MTGELQTALDGFAAELDEAKVPWDFDRETRSWSRDFVYELTDSDEILDFLGSLQLTAVDLGEGQETPVLQLSFYLLDGIDTPAANGFPLLTALTRLNSNQLCVKWTQLLDPGTGEITGVCAATDTYIQAISPAFLSTVFNSLLSAVIEAYPDLLAVTEKMRMQ